MTVNTSDALTEREFKLTLPKWDNEGHKIKVEMLESYAKGMSDHFGGVSIIPSVLGCWYNRKKGRLQCEENIILVSGLDSSDPKKIRAGREFVNKLALKAGKDLGQADIYVNEDIVKDVEFVHGDFQEKLSKSKLGQDWFEKLI